MINIAFTNSSKSVFSSTQLFTWGRLGYTTRTRTSISLRISLTAPLVESGKETEHGRLAPQAE